MRLAAAGVLLFVVVVGLFAVRGCLADRFGLSAPPFGPPTPAFDEATFVSALAFSGDGQVLGVGTNSGLVSLWRAADGQPTASLRPRLDRIESLALDADASLVAMGFKLGFVALWDQRRRAEVGTIDLVPLQPADPHGNPASLSFQPGGRTVLCLDSDYSLVRFLDVATGSQFEPLRLAPRRVASASFSNLDQRFLALGDGTAGHVEVFDLLAGQSLGTVAPGGAVAHAIAISPDGTRVAAAQSHALFYLWDVATKESLSMFDGQGPVTALAFSPDGRLLASGGQGVVVVWDAFTYRELRRLDLNAAPRAH